MKPNKSDINARQIVHTSVEALEKFQSAHSEFVHTNSEEAKQEMAEAMEIVQSLEEDLAVPNESADLVRLAFLRQTAILEANVNQIHTNGLYPDLYRDSESPLMLLIDIISCYKIALLTMGEKVPLLELSSTTTPWKDEGLLAFCADIKNNLQDIKFTKLLDAVLWYDKNKSAIISTFDILLITGDLGEK